MQQNKKRCVWFTLPKKSILAHSYLSKFDATVQFKSWPNSKNCVQMLVVTRKGSLPLFLKRETSFHTCYKLFDGNPLWSKSFADQLPCWKLPQKSIERFEVFASLTLKRSILLFTFKQFFHAFVFSLASIHVRSHTENFATLETAREFTMRM